MLNSIVMGALGGALGAAFGSLLVFAWGKLRGDSSRQSKTVGGMIALGFGLVGARLAAAFSEPSLESLLDTNPAIAALHEHFPAEYQQLVAAVRDEGLSDPAALQAKTTPIVSRIVVANTGRLDAERAKAMAQLVVDEARLLRDKDPGSCIAFLEGRPSAVSLNSVLSQDMMTRDHTVTAAILTQVATMPAKPPLPLSDEDALALAMAAIEKLPTHERAVAGPLFTEGRQPTSAIELRAKCDLTIGMLEAALQGPQERLRAVLAAG
jgi:hypothetical protein